MAVEVENTSQVEELSRVLKRRLWWILVPACIIIVFGVSYAIVVPKKYVAKAEVMVHERPATMVQGSTSITAEGRVAGHKLKASQLIKSVLIGLDWDEYRDLPTVSEEVEYRKWVNKNITVSVPPMESKVQQQKVAISYSHTRADMAEQFLKALVERWQKDVLAKHTRSLTDQHDQLTESRVNLEKKSERIAEKLLALRSDNQIPPKMSDDRGQPVNQMAPAFEEVRRLGGRLDLEVEALDDHRVALERSEEEEARMPDMIPKSESVDREVSSEELVQAEHKLALVQADLDKGRYAPGHSKRMPLERKAAQLRKTIDQLRNLDPEMEDHLNYGVVNTDKQNLKHQIVIDRADLVRLERAVDLTLEKLANAKKAADSLQKVYTEIGLEESKMTLVQGNLQSVSADLLEVDKKIYTQDSPERSPFEDLLHVEASDEPIEPNAWLISLFSVVVGLGVGLALAVSLEFSRNCFRSINDIARAMEIPVLGAVNRIETRRQRHIRRVQKLVASICMLLTMGIVGFTLWAWALDPSLLKPSVLESIDRLREMLG